MSFQCPSETNIAPNQLAAEFPGEKRLLPSSILSTDRDSQGMLKPTMLSDWVGRLEGAGILPAVKGTPPTVYTAKITALLDAAKQEYCFYDSRYRASLEYLFTAIRNATSRNTAESKQVIDNRLQTTKTLNRKVNDMIQIMNAIADKMMKSSTTLQAEIEQFNKRLRAQRDKLEEQNKMIQSNEAAMRLQKEMVNYSTEKARYSDNLLKMYSFLNVVAFGLLLYVYKAAGDE
jgi:hypothetical protein